MCVSSFIGVAHHGLLFVCMKGSKGETFALIFSEEFTLLQTNVMHLIGRAAPVGPVPLVRRACTALPETEKGN